MQVQAVNFTVAANVWFWLGEQSCWNVKAEKQDKIAESTHAMWLCSDR